MPNIEMDKSSLHICIVTGQFPALTETFVTSKAVELSNRGHRITVIKNQQGGAINKSHIELVNTAGIEIISFKEPSTVKSLLFAIIQNPIVAAQSFSANAKTFKSRFVSKLQLALLNKYPFDIIHFEFSGLAVAYHHAIKQVKTNMVVSCRGTAEKVKTISDLRRKDKLTAVFDSVSSIHCVSQDMADTIIPFCNQPQKIFVNRPSIDVNIFKRSKVNYPISNKIIILSVGRFTFQKGYLPGLLAIKELKNRGLSFCWKIVGDGPQLEEIQYYIHDLQLQEVVELAGKKSRNEVIELYHDCHVFFLPSVYEGIANVCLEAMAMELPVVATRSGGMEEVIENGIDGLLVDKYDHHMMANQLQMIVENAPLRYQMGLNARNKVETGFTLERQVNVFEKEYKKLIQKN